jgi:hypothetical protein
MNPDNENMERVLREALRRKAAPPDFAANVLAKTRAALPVAMRGSFSRPPKRWLQRPFTLALAASMAAVAIVPAVVQEHERAKGLKAKRDLLTALAITKDQFQQAREKVRRTARNSQ